MKHPTPRLRHRFLAAACTAALVAFVPAPLALAGDAGGEDPSESCIGDDPVGPLAALAWLGLPGADSETRGSSVTLEVRNTGDLPADMTVSVTTDSGDGRSSTRRSKLRAMAPDAVQSVVVDLGRLRAPADMAFAGQILASVEVRPAGACDARACKPLRANPDGGDAAEGEGGDDPRSDETPSGPSFVMSTPLHFHPSADAGLFEIYGADVLVGEYNGGDLTGRVLADPSVLPDADVVVMRTTDIGRGLAANSKRMGEQAILPVDSLSIAPPPSDPAPKDGYRLCVRWEVQVTEQGRKVTLPNKTVITEDYWHGYSTLSGTGAIVNGVPKNDGKMAVTARGPKVLVHKNDWLLETFADPATGCFSFTSPQAPPFTVYVSSEHRDSNNNRTIVHTGALTLLWAAQVNPPKGKTRLVHVGNFSADATLAAMAAFGMYRSTMGVTGKTVRLTGVNTCGTEGGNNSSAHFNFDGLASGTAYLRLSAGGGIADDETGPCTKSDHRRAKFIVMHELGHAWMLLRTKKNEPGVSTGLVDPNEFSCSDGASYTQDSLEYSSLGAREGTAHFYSAAVWNNTASANGVFSMFGSARNIRQFSSTPGGQLWNACDTPYKCGKTVIMDWGRFWWNAHAPSGGAHKFGHSTIGAIYESAFVDGGMTVTSAYEKFEEAMQGLVASESMRTAFRDSAVMQGVRTSPSGLYCGPAYLYPNCGSNPPSHGAGEPDCPCTDVLELNPNTAHLADTDGYHGDGQGSYSETGSAQYCLGNDVVCGLISIGDGVNRAPICQECIFDTMVGCDCYTDEECNNGTDSQPNSCHGAPIHGWSGSHPGKCLPSPETAQGRQDLVELPWFCLDNCASKGSSYGCLYDQLAPSISNDHARCVEISACSAPYGYCEAAGASMCDVETVCADDWEDCCVAECGSNADCTGLLGFPNFYECSMGSCVPPECNNNATPYCNLYR